MQLKKLNAQLEKDFIVYMNSSGYTEVSPLPISSKVDSSVRLIGSAFSRLRSYTSLDSYSVFTIQRAIRTQILNSYYDECAEQEFCSYHVSFGVIVDSSKIQALVASCFDFIINCLEFPLNKLRIRASSSDTLLVSCLQIPTLQSRLILDSEIESRYSHQYGLGICGRGIKIDFQQSDHYKNIAHIIALFCENNKNCIGAELSFTNASVIMRKYNLTYAIDVMPIADMVPCNNFAQRRYADSLTVVTHLLFEGVRPNSSKMDGRLLKRYLKALDYYSNILNISQDVTIQHILSYAYMEYEENHLANVDLKGLINHY